MKAFISTLFVCLSAASLPAWAAGELHKTAATHSNFSAGLARLPLRSGAVLVLDQETGEPLLAKNTDQVLPIASITKLMTAMVIIDRGLDLEESVTLAK